MVVSKLLNNVKIFHRLTAFVCVTARKEIIKQANS